jgi:hypothetical protein
MCCYLVLKIPIPFKVSGLADEDLLQFGLRMMVKKREKSVLLLGGVIWAWRGEKRSVACFLYGDGRWNHNLGSVKGIEQVN